MLLSSEDPLRYIRHIESVIRETDRQIEKLQHKRAEEVALLLDLQAEHGLSIVIRDKLLTK